MVFLAIYLKLNLANKINHLDNLPLKAGFSNKYSKGSILATIHTWNGRMLCLNFCTTHTKAKQDFSMDVYLFS